jgi:serine protease AprX
LAAALMLLFAAAPEAGASGVHRGGATVRPSDSPKYVNHRKIDDELSWRADHGDKQALTRVIVTLKPGQTVPPRFRQFIRGFRLNIINGAVLELPNHLIRELAGADEIFDLHFDRPIQGANYRTSLTVGARAVQRLLGLTGAGVGVAVIDSGVTSWHDDLTNRSATVYPYGNQRVSAFVDFVNGGTTPYDDNGHGTHVAGTILGNGYDSRGQKAGMAPDASLVALKVLDAKGGGTIANIIAALDWVLQNHTAYNIRVVNMSVGAPVTESYWTDPLTLAAKRVVDAGVTVVAAAGNFGKNASGQLQYGGISSPGNAPWVLTVGASSTNGTPFRSDDTMGSYSSRGPTYVDWAAKPDLVAPGTGTVSLASANSTLYNNDAQFLVPGIISTSTTPYLTLSGTSMAAPVVSGTIALMLQANPNLTPNAIKAILEYTAEQNPNYNPLTEGAGFLNSLGAVRLARFFATAQPGATIPTQAMWSKHIIWGNHMVSSGVITPTANAWAPDTTWGSDGTATGQNIVWGMSAAGDNVVWGMSRAGDNIVWGMAGADDNVVWGMDCGGGDCDNVVWGMVDADNIVWGMANPGDNIVWGASTTTSSSSASGMSAADNIVWGMSADDNIVWGMSGDDNIVWGMSSDDNVVWGMSGGDNIVWGMSGGTVVWSPSSTGGIQWGTLGSTGVWPLSSWSLFNWMPDDQLLRLIIYEELTPPPSTTSSILPWGAW